MTESEFMRSLQGALYGNIPDRVLESNVQYYREYFAEQRQRGRSEEEICDEIGSPLLIARTVMDATNEESYYRTTSEAGMDSGGSYQQAFYINGNPVQLKWYTKVLMVLIPILFIGFLLMVLAGLFQLAVKLFVPVLVIWLLWQLVKFVFGHARR